jgi:hypothetical protein
MDNLREEIRKLKHTLYYKLLKIPIDNLTDEEIRLAYFISHDKEIQETLERYKNENK